MIETNHPFTLVSGHGVNIVHEGEFYRVTREWGGLQVTVTYTDPYGVGREVRLDYQEGVMFSLERGGKLSVDARDVFGRTNHWSYSLPK